MAFKTPRLPNVLSSLFSRPHWVRRCTAGLRVISATEDQRLSKGAHSPEAVDSPSSRPYHGKQTLSSKPSDQGTDASWH